MEQLDPLLLGRSNVRSCRHTPTAALIYTASSVAKIPSSVFSSTRTLAVHMYLLSNEGLYIGQTYGTAVVLLVLVLVINGLSGFVADKLAKR